MYVRHYCEFTVLKKHICYCLKVIVVQCAILNDGKLHSNRGEFTYSIKVCLQILGSASACMEKVV